jgi:8-oxo-dGTP diphosphatase
MEATRVACVGAVVRDDRNRVLLVRRGTEPAKGRWSVPGGRVEPGESVRDAVRREVLEETGLRVLLSGLAGVVERPGPDGVVYVIEDFYARLEAGTDPDDVRAGDDADEVGWFHVEQLDDMDVVDGLIDAFQRWKVIPRQR